MPRLRAGEDQAEDDGYEKRGLRHGGELGCERGGSGIRDAWEPRFSFSFSILGLAAISRRAASLLWISSLFRQTNRVEHPTLGTR